ncbi:hypothetical protein MLD38_023112 [Melastoma candidum]|uniref:Uncharacterized protein n=1 Tax=Melastoma candidum TaxID=119954 RepID=A0ACB9QKM3_9MYRT|nr:hypothetical protein MLD38_023112 [Melastoma candidum]
MISSKKLLQLARKWQMAAAIGRNRISFHRSSSRKSSDDSTGASVAQKGHFTVYTADGQRFEIPLSYLSSGVIRELFSMAEEEFGIPSGGAIVLPIDASSMEYITSLIRRGLGTEQENALLVSISRCSSYVPAIEAQNRSQVLCM